MKTYNEYVMVTDWEKVEVDDFYLTDEGWAKNLHPDNLKQAKELAKAGELYIAYVVPAVHYAIYIQMDARQIFIDGEGDQIMSCEGVVIANNHEKCFEYTV